MSTKFPTQLSAEALIAAAQQHGEDSEPDHEVGDLQVFLRKALSFLSPHQKRVMLFDPEVRETLAVALGLDEAETPKPAREKHVRGALVNAKLTELPMVQINAPEVFKDSAFVAFLDSPTSTTWHSKGGEVTEYSDVFFTWDNGEGSDAPDGVGGGIPQHIWDQLSEFLWSKGYKNAFVRLTNEQA